MTSVPITCVYQHSNQHMSPQLFAALSYKQMLRPFQILRHQRNLPQPRRRGRAYRLGPYILRARHVDLSNGHSGGFAFPAELGGARTGFVLSLLERISSSCPRASVWEKFPACPACRFYFFGERDCIWYDEVT